MPPGWQISTAARARLADPSTVRSLANAMSRLDDLGLLVAIRPKVQDHQLLGASVRSPGASAGRPPIRLDLRAPAALPGPDEQEDRVSGRIFLHESRNQEGDGRSRDEPRKGG
jgi:hypothetical protein